MPAPDQPEPTSRRDHGAAALIILLMLMLAGSYFLVSALNRRDSRIAQDKVSAATLAQAKDALIGYALSRSISVTTPGAVNVQCPGDLPFPDYFDAAESPSFNYDGRADSGCMDVSQATGIPLIGTGVNMRCLGRLPWVTLGLSYGTTEENDPAGLMPWYAVSANMVRDPANPADYDTWFDKPVTWLTVLDANGNPISNSVAAVIIIPGPVVPTLPPLPPALQSRPLAPLHGPEDYLDSVTVPAGCTAPCVAGTYSNADLDADLDYDFIVGPPADTFNDRVLFITRDELLKAVKDDRNVNECPPDQLISWTEGSANCSAHTVAAGATGATGANCDRYPHNPLLNTAPGYTGSATVRCNGNAWELYPSPPAPAPTCNPIGGGGGGILQEFIHGSAVSFNGTQIIGNDATIVVTGDLTQQDINGGAAIGVTNAYIDGNVSLGGSQSLGSQTEPGIIYINGNLELSGSADIYGKSIYVTGNITMNGSPYLGLNDNSSNIFALGNVNVTNGVIHGNLYAGGNLYLKSATLFQDAFVNGNLELDWTPSFMPGVTVSYKGSLETPDNFDQDILADCIHDPSLPPVVIPVAMPSTTIPALKDPAWYSSNGYVSGGALANNKKIFATGNYSTGQESASNIVLVSEGDITIGGGNSAISGVVFAPNGSVTIGGDSFTGWVIARDGVFVTRGGSTVTLIPVSTLIPSMADYPFVYP